MKSAQTSRRQSRYFTCVWNSLWDARLKMRFIISTSKAPSKRHFRIWEQSSKNYMSLNPTQVSETAVSVALRLVSSTDSLMVNTSRWDIPSATNTAFSVRSWSTAGRQKRLTFGFRVAKFGLSPVRKRRSTLALMVT